MSEWEHQSDYYQGDETESTRTGFRWTLEGEVKLGLFLWGIDGGRFEMTYIVNHPTLARQLPGLYDRDIAIERTEKGEVHIDEPFWRGWSPQQLEDYCSEHSLPLPPNYKEYWQAYRDEEALRVPDSEADLL